MQVLVTGEEMKALDAYSIDTIGIPSLVLMERAAYVCSEEVDRRVPGKKKVLVFAGTGNNGADGLVMARIFSMEGDDVRVVVTGNRGHATEEWLRQYRICDNLGIPMTPDLPDRDDLRAGGFDVLVDAMLGTGLSREVTGKTAQAIELMNESGIFIVSVDMPSGISSDTGKVMGCAVRASLTVSFEFGKRGLSLFPGEAYAGEKVVRSIGISRLGLDVVAPKAFTLTAEDLKELPVRVPSSNKGTYGRVLVIAGSENMAGAAVLAAESAYRSGAGLVRVFTPECNRLILQTRLPEAILTTYDPEFFSPEVLDALCEWASAIVIGPGLGTRDQAARFLQYILQYAGKPLVIDADAVNILARKPEMREYLNRNCILTPHLGEMSRLSGVPVPQIQEDPVGTAEAFQKDCEAVLVQKDARTVVLPPDGRFCFINTLGNSGMSTGGSGDVLAGIIGGLLAAGMETSKAAVYGVLLHAHAGDLAAAEKGERAMLAGDIVAALR